MIKYNLKEERYKNHPLDDKYGTITANSIYSGYPVTLVDNHNEVVGGKYTHNPALCLLHLSEDVRQYTRLKLFDDFLYLSFAFSTPTYRMHNYNYEVLEDGSIINILKNVFYFVQPKLQSHSLVGSSSKELEDDPNYYEGNYVLNDEEEYTILKCRDTYKFYRGKKSYYPDWKKDDDLIFEDKINFEVYKQSLETAKVKWQIVVNTNQMLDEDVGLLGKYVELKKVLDGNMKLV